ncbi:MAG: hypothetical protein BWK76_12595 [Desulfobulbaceae bacterium A2]|nr:MAG: hypothetical protein BWK76_12595 [Desulfobulbaceae bacterium A2]
MRCGQNILFFLLVSWLLPAAAAVALDASEVAVVINAKARDSRDLARYYMAKRGIPPEQLIVLRSTWEEVCSREEFDRDIRGPLRQALKNMHGQGRRIRALAVIYGMPLKISPPLPSWSEEEEIEGLRQQLKQLPDHNSPEAKGLKGRLDTLRKSNTQAALDSELTLVLLDDQPLDGWLPNPWFLGFKGQQDLIPREQVLLVSRLDGPDPATVRRIIDDSLAAEEQGLTGQLCLDARGPRPELRNLRGYALYDAAIHLAAEKVPQRRPMPVILDEQPQLLPAGLCDHTALYCGWYSLGHYIDAFGWQRGAVGYHIASNECATLKQPGSTVWCKRMLEEGAAAVIGPVYEPYVEAFPLPDLFFLQLVDGRLSLVESYFLSLPYLSWQMVLVGDPLYRPYRQHRE